MLKFARDAYRAIGAEGFARVDFLVAGDAIVLSEINTIPGFTPISLFPTMPAAGGYDFAGVCGRIVDLALERHAARTRPAPDPRRTCPDERPTRAQPAAATPSPGPPVAARSRRASAGLSPVRAGAALVMLARPAADLRRRRARPPSTYRVGPRSSGARSRDPAAVESTLALARGQNLFGLVHRPPLAAGLERFRP